MSTVASSQWFCSVSLCLLSRCMFNRPGMEIPESCFCSCGRGETFHHLSKWLLQSAGWMLHIYDRETDLTVRQRCLCQSWCECAVNEAGKLQLRLKLDEGGNVGSSRRTESDFWSLCSIVSVFPLFRLLLVYSLCCWTFPDFSFMSLFAINICGLWSWVTLSLCLTGVNVLFCGTFYTKFEALLSFSYLTWCECKTVCRSWYLQPATNQRVKQLN